MLFDELFLFLSQGHTRQHLRLLPLTLLLFLLKSDLLSLLIKLRDMDNSLLNDILESLVISVKCL